MKPLLEIRNLKIALSTATGKVYPVNDVSLTVGQSEVLGIAGESGSGKSVLALSILSLLQRANFQIESGEILFSGKSLLGLSEKDLSRIRGKEISMIFQEPMTALNPVLSVGHQIEECFTIHQPGLSRQQRVKQVIELLRKVGIENPDDRFKSYPHQLSGGQRQRVLIAMAIANKPRLLIADEPTTALDVSVQKQIMDLLKNLQREMGMSMIFISHDLPLMVHSVDRVAIMYAGNMLEVSDARELVSRPFHHYTKSLLGCILPLKPLVNSTSLKSIPGAIPSLNTLPQGCVFQSRCEGVQEKCKSQTPQLTELSKNHWGRCWYPLGESL